jgi:hypothetical protein
MSKQKIYTPPILNCWCGTETEIDSDDFGQEVYFRIRCKNRHTLTNYCRTKNRAIWRWNNRVAAKLAEIKLDLYKKLL